MDKADEFISFIGKLVDDVQAAGVDFTITYTTKAGPVGFTFHGAPFKGKSREVINAQICWEVNQLEFPS